MNYEFKQFIIEKNPTDFFSWCLSNQLYKESTSQFSSRMKSYFSGEKQFTGLTAVIAFENEVPIGIVLCEHADKRKQSMQLKNSFRLNSKIKESYKWTICNLGFINMFIKEEHRNKNLATILFQRVEFLRLQELSKSQELNENIIPVFQARELSYVIIDKKSNYSYSSEYSPDSVSYSGFIHDLTTSLISYENKDPAPIYPLNKKKDLNASDFIQNKYVIENSLVKKLKFKV